jgi:hypothetical protein
MSTEHVAIFAIVIAAGSELIAMNPKLSSNSWVQLIVKALKDIFPKKTPNE